MIKCLTETMRRRFDPWFQSSHSITMEKAGWNPVAHNIAVRKQSKKKEKPRTRYSTQRYIPS